jgi:hypothetical protein
MSVNKPCESTWQALLDIKLIPAEAHLPAAVRVERRDLAGRRALLCRIYGEFAEMRGLSLTLEQAARLFGLPRSLISRVLERLTDERVLSHRSDGQFALRVEESPVNRIGASKL